MFYVQGDIWKFTGICDHGLKQPFTPKYALFVLFDLVIYIPVNHFLVFLDWTSTKQG